MRKFRENGFVLPMTIFLILGVTAISIGMLFNGKMGRMSAINYKNKIRTFMASDGMVTLLAQELINGKAYKYVDSTRTGRIRGEIWTGIAGGSVSNFEKLTKTTPYSDTLSSPYLGSSLEQFNFGLKWTGWVIPPLSGSYTFITRSDDESHFYLSSDDDPKHLGVKPICRIEPGWVTAWPSSGSGVSAPVSLEAGKRYYFEYYHKQGGGWTVGQVGWNGPEFFAERPITGQYLSEYRTDPVYNSSTLVGTVPVRYRVAPIGMDAYRITSEAILMRPGHPTDTAYRQNLVQSLSLQGVAVQPPKQSNLPVIYHDFPSVGHPEFDMPVYAYGVKKDMVQSTLSDSTVADAGYFGRTHIPKPVRNIPSANYGCGVNKWFKDWTFDPLDYQYSTATDCNKTKANPAGDTYKNVKIYDSLQFDLDASQGPYTYVFSRMGNLPTGDPLTSFRGEQEFFPLDSHWHDPIASPHNYSFCMEMHTTFLYQSGLIFEFTGDDDVWTFINNKLVIDLGGIHSSTNSILNLDDLNWLSYGQTYAFDFFQCERHEFSSTSRIVTNLKMGRPHGAPVSNWHRDYGMLN
ncbi:MAG: fibro-slime domain-containing protein [Fibrobacteres bacterium]|nr:fibro-slime domain-containing protein [Fibrobacterota bacterium]